MYRGYTRRWRAIEDWEWYKTPHMAHLFQHIIGKANHQAGKWQGIPVERGQLITGRKALSEATGISEQSIRTSLRNLEKTAELTIKSTNRFSIITVNEYEKYQSNESDNQQSNQQSTSNQPATNHKQECKNEKNEKNTYGVRSETQSLFESINGMCDQYAIENGVRMKSLDPIVERYLGKVRMKVEAQHCISWLIDRGLRKVTTQRLGNWFKKSQEIQKRDQLKQLEWKEAQNNPYQKKRAGELREQNIRNPECFPIDSDM